MNAYYDVEDNHYRTYPDGDIATIDQMRELVENKDFSIAKLQQENKQLKRIIKENTILIKDEYGDYQECNINPLRMKQKYEKQVDNWNKLKDYVSAEWYSYDNDSVECEVAKDILDKMQELEQGSDSK